MAQEHRLGTCGDCGAEYRLPATFSADKAKCKACGGVVAVGPVKQAPKPMPTKQAARREEAMVEHKPSGKQAGGPSMKERLLAERAAAAGAAAAPAAKRAAASPPAAKAPASKAPAAKAPARKPSASKAPARRGASTEESEDKPARSDRGSRGAGSGSRSSARRAGGSGRRGRGEDEGDEDGGRRRRGPEKKSPMPLVLGAVALLLLLGGGYYFLGQKDSQAAGTGDGDTSVADGGTTPDAGSQDGTDGATDGGTPESADPGGAAATDGPDAPADGAPDVAPDPTPDPGPATAADGGEPSVDNPATVAPRNNKGMQSVFLISKKPDYAKYPDSVYDPEDSLEPNLSSLEPFGVPDGCSEEQWAEIQELAATMVDPLAGAAGNRARKSLETEFGKFAYPAIINMMLALDYGTQDGNNTGDICQKTLQFVANGRNAGWYYDFASEPNKTHILNKRAVQTLYDAWARCLAEPDYWDRYAKTAQKEGGGTDGSDEGGSDEAPKEPAPAEDVDAGLDDIDF